ncbi:MAG TPA: tyrosine-protein phosphatase [Verrucomicrobiae bacterium]|nr:tyrosine-protein phosphatase [Verrucomicrobiae bacterium]
MAADARALRWEALLNARDLGGLPSGAGTIARAAIVRADALYRLNDAGWAALVAHGVRTIIDMRNEKEVAAKPYRFDGDSGVVLAHIAQQTDEMWQSLPRPIDRVTFDTTMLELARSRFASIAEAVAGAPEGGVLIHCEAGKDRTGLMTMLLLDLVGTPVDVIAADYTLTAIGLAPLFADLIAKADTPERRARLEEEALTRPEVMLAIHKVLRTRYGGAEPYLVSGGARPESLARIRARMLGRPSPAT